MSYFEPTQFGMIPTAMNHLLNHWLSHTRLDRLLKQVILHEPLDNHYITTTVAWPSRPSCHPFVGFAGLRLSELLQLTVFSKINPKKSYCRAGSGNSMAMLIPVNHWTYHQSTIDIIHRSWSLITIPMVINLFVISTIYTSDSWYQPQILINIVEH